MVPWSAQNGLGRPLLILVGNSRSVSGAAGRRMGAIFKRTSNHEWRPAHLHFMVTGKGLAPLITEIFVRGSKYLEEDTAFAVREGLVADFKPNNAGKGPDGRK